MDPQTMRWHIEGASRLLRGRTSISVGDYRHALQKVDPVDLVYMDPPYQGVSLNRDPRYIGLLNFDDFTAALNDLNERAISFIVSYDGRSGDKRYGRLMPDSLALTHIEIEAGRSSQATLLGRSNITYESLYLSPALVERIGPVHSRHLTLTPKQISLLAQDAT